MAESEIEELSKEQIDAICNFLCYCRQPLSKGKMRSPGWTCLSCWRQQSALDVYYCGDQQCLLGKHTAREYVICPSCYNAEHDNEEMKTEQNEMPRNFMHSKLTQSLAMIS